MIDVTCQVKNLVCNKCATDHIAEAPPELNMVLSYYQKLIL